MGENKRKQYKRQEQQNNEAEKASDKNNKEKKKITQSMMLSCGAYPEHAHMQRTHFALQPIIDPDAFAQFDAERVAQRDLRAQPSLA